MHAMNGFAGSLRAKRLRREASALKRLFQSLKEVCVDLVAGQGAAIAEKILSRAPVAKIQNMCQHRRLCSIWSVTL